MKWRVRVTREVTESCDIEVEAPTREEANDKALSFVCLGDVEPNWQTDDAAPVDCYVPDSDSTEEVEA